MDTSYISVIFLPQGLLEYFDITGIDELCFVKDRSVYFQISLEERNMILGDVDGTQYESKGFTEITLQDFLFTWQSSLFGNKRRRWRHKKRLVKLSETTFHL
ncbi:MAG: hypothetical protein IPH58_18810 [Sphingobacteriales bacterium]|nr:hypothetical protein [Sphingobacteriales bacterium]